MADNDSITAALTKSIAFGGDPSKNKHARELFQSIRDTHGEQAAQDMMNAVVVHNKENKQSNPEEKVKDFFSTVHDIPHVEKVKSSVGDAEGPITFLNSYFESDEFKRRYKLDDKMSNLYNTINYPLAMQHFESARDRYKPFVQSSDDHVDHVSGADDEGEIKNKPWLPKGTNIQINPKDMGPIEFGNLVFADRDFTKVGSIKEPVFSDKEKMSFALNSILPHEYAHTVRKLSEDEQKKVYDLSKRDSYTLNWSTPHDIKPNEQYSDLSTFRWLMYKEGHYDARKGDLDKDTLNKALKDDNIKNDPIVKRLLDHFTIDNLIEFNNTIANKKNKSNESESSA